MSNQSTKSDNMNDDGMLNAETQRKLPQGKILQPKLRFKGFTDPWQQRKLGELGFTYSGLSGKNKSDFGHGSAYFVTYLNVFSNPIADCYGIEAVEIDDKQHKVITGDIFFTASSETPEDVGMTSLWLGAQDNLYLNSFCFGYRMTANHNSIFMAYSLRSPQFRSKIQLLAQGISRFNISKKKVMELISTFPSLSEQIRIGEFFRVLDDLIAAAKKKADLLKLKKRYYLQAIFSQQLRFKGFTEPWQQRKLGELLSVRKETTTTPTLYRIDIELENLQEDGGLVGDTTVRTNSTSVFRRGDVLFGRLRPYLRKWWLATEPGIRSGEIWAIYSPSRVLTSSFVYALVQSPIFLQVALITSGTKMPRSDWENIASAAGSLPCSNDEQARIGDFFNMLDNLIAASWRKIELLERCKAAYLQLLFI
ncbi:type I restriction enzyme specificity protein [Bifidobacterium pullorum subsp. saeculare DSM 6531 = LMG 14934]|uniref:Type I restriction enzyme specificity protein n=2 Tax=Bifidobacterium pullorum TaxID=78448 RepID=A0A087CU57_9BIFI|nr:restriction endonuclease subunit S [Bifidobacterium pullorum]KFI86807.1 type I restriction enzyme specificity protein [Bifidobacterium pullorum subsp. saeculare DSM 6531 = LMG 14934]